MSRALPTLGLYALALAIVAFALFPFAWAVISSLKTGAAIFDASPIPAEPSLRNYAAIFAEQPFGRTIVNSLIVGAGTVALSLVLGLGAAYALGRVAFRGRALLLMVILAVSMFPQVAVLSGMFELVTTLGLYDTHAALIVSYLIFTLPFTTWVLTTFMRDLPKELEEAALVDGASPWIIITRIFLPLMGPALASTTLLAFLVAWNEFLFALTFTLTAQARTVPVAIALISGASQYEVPWGPLMAASVTVTLPMIALVLVFQRKIVSGLTAGAVKG